MKELQVEKKTSKKLLWRNGFMKQLRLRKKLQKIALEKWLHETAAVEKTASKIAWQKWLHETAAG